MSKKKSSSKKGNALVVLAEAQSCTAVQLSQLQAVALAQIRLVSQMEREGSMRAIIAGMLLHRIKHGVAHGEFMPWIKANLDGAGYRQANYYMRLALVAIEKTRATRAEIQALPANSKELSLTASDAEAKKLFQKLEKFVGDRSLNELLREFGIKDSKALGGARETAEEAAAADAEADAEQLYLFARDEIGSVIQRAEQLFLTENRLQYLAGHPEEIRGAVEGLRALADKVEAAAKPFLKK